MQTLPEEYSSELPVPDPLDPGALNAEIPALELRQRSARGALVTFGSQGLRFAISFGTQLVLAHMLVPAQFGIVAMAAPVLGFVGIFTDLGLSQGTIQRKTISHEELNALFWINVALSVALAGLVAALSPLIWRFYHQPQVGPVVIALALLLPLGGLSSQAVALLSRRMQFTSLAAIDLSAALLAAVAALAAAHFGAGYWALVVQQAAVSLVTLVLVWPLSDWTPSRPRLDPRVGSLLRFGGHLTAFNTLSYFTLYFDNVLVGYLSGAAALGLFERAFRLVLQPMSQVTAPIGRIATPMLSRLVDADEAYARAFARMLQVALLATAPGLLCCSVLSRQVVLALLGPAWLGAAPIIAWLSFAGALSAYTLSACWLFVSQARVREQMRCGVLSSVLILLSLLAGLHWGPVGIAASYAVFAPAVHGVYVWGATRRGPVRLSHFAADSWPIWIAVTVTGVLLRALRDGVALRPMPLVLLGAVLSYVACFATLALIPRGYRMLRGLWELRALLSNPTNP